jgi:hypothetical protein
MPVQTDILRTELQVVGLEQSNQKLDSHYAKAKATSAGIDALGKKSADEALARRTQFEADVNASRIQTANLNREIQDLQKAASGKLGTGAANIFSGLEGPAKAAGAQIAATRARLLQIQAAAARTTNPKVFDGLVAEAKVAQAELDRLENKIQRVAQFRQARGLRGRVSLGSLGNIAGGLGSFLPGPLGDAAQAAALVPPGGFGGLGAATIGTGTLAAAGSLAAAGALIVKYSKEARQDAEARLAAEEKIQGAINKQIIGARETRIEFEKQSQAAAAGRQFNKDLNSQSIGELTRRRDLLKQLNEINPNGDVAQERQTQRLAIESRLADLQDKKTADADAAFAQRFENFRRSQAAQVEADKAFEESVAKGAEKIRELGTTSKELFADLAAAQGENNPFVKLFTEADAAIEKTRLTTATLNAELQQSAEVMTATANANRLFSARLGSALEASDLRADAARFRDSGNDDAALLASVQAFRRQETEGLFRNPALKFALQAGATAQTRLDLFNERIADEQNSGLFRNPAADAAVRRSLELDAGENISERDRFERQLAVIQSLRPENEAQRAEADRKIIELGRNLDPAALSESDRSAIAQALENQAVRTENAEAEAKAARDTANQLNASIDANISELLKVAKSEGLTGVIRIINEAENQAKVSLGNRPTEKDMTGRVEF